MKPLTKKKLRRVLVIVGTAIAQILIVCAIIGLIAGIGMIAINNGAAADIKMIKEGTTLQTAAPFDIIVVGLAFSLISVVIGVIFGSIIFGIIKWIEFTGDLGDKYHSKLERVILKRQKKKESEPRWEV